MNSKFAFGIASVVLAAAFLSGCRSTPVPRIVADPYTWTVEDAGISNEYGRVEGVYPIWIKGEDYLGKPTRFFAWWGLPKGATPERKVPAMVLVHGGCGTAFASWVKTWNDRGYAAIAMDNCSSAPRGEWDGQEHPRHEWSGPYGWGDERGYNRGGLKDEWPYHAISAIMRCNSFLRNRPEIDADRIGVTGISWGGYLTSIVAGIDHRFAFAAPVYGCGWYDWNRLWDDTAGGTEAYRKWIEHWDARHYIGGTRCPVLRCNGDRDRFYTMEMTAKSMDALPWLVDASLSIKPNMPHGHSPWGDPQEIKVFADYYLKDGYRPLKIGSTKLSGNELTVTYDPNDESVARAELWYLEDVNEKSENRKWNSIVFELAGKDSCEATVEVPVTAKIFYFNVITDNGNVITSRIIVRE